MKSSKNGKGEKWEAGPGSKRVKVYVNPIQPSQMGCRSDMYFSHTFSSNKNLSWKIPLFHIFFHGHVTCMLFCSYLQWQGCGQAAAHHFSWSASGGAYIYGSFHVLALSKLYFKKGLLLYRWRCWNFNHR